MNHPKQRVLVRRYYVLKTDEGTYLTDGFDRQSSHRSNAIRYDKPDSEIVGLFHWVAVNVYRVVRKKQRVYYQIKWGEQYLGAAGSTWYSNPNCADVFESREEAIAERVRYYGEFRKLVRIVKVTSRRRVK